MGTCSFCQRRAEQGVWLRRWRNGAEGARDVGGSGVRDALVSLCAWHLQACLIEHRVLRRGGWSYG